MSNDQNNRGPQNQAPAQGQNLLQQQGQILQQLGQNLVQQGQSLQRGQAPQQGQPPPQGQDPQHGQDQQHGGHGEDHFDPAPHRPSAGRLALTVGLGVAVFGVLVVVGVVPRLKARATTREDHHRAETSEGRVMVVRPTRSTVGANGVTLSASIQPVQETQIYPRTNGYVSSYRVDIGDAVAEGQVLATVDSPEVRQELRQAQASVLQARAGIQQARTQRELAQVEATRYTNLVQTGVVTQQETTQRRAQADVAAANLAAAQAQLAASEANVRRLQDLLAFDTVRAPFAGTITARTIEVGQLVTAGSAAGQALFRLSKTDVVRVMVNVPQLYASAVHVGSPATLRLREFPTRPFHGTITRSARELDTATRTLLTEVRVPNADGALIAGMYTQLTLQLERVVSPLSVPATALVNGADGTRMAVVSDGAVHWRPVHVDSDQGDRVTVADGLAENDDVVVTPSDHLVEGLRVHAEMAPPPAARRP